MIRSMWTYPWDILDIGKERVYSDLFDTAKLNSISLAMSYHAGRFVQPRSPKRKVYFPEDGTLYFHVSPELYEEQLIRPKTVSYVDECDALIRELENDRRERGFRLSSWFVCLHNTRIGMEYPEATVVNAFGDYYYYNLCPSNPAARTYITTVLKDLTSNYEVDAVELESLSFMGFPHEFHHEKDGVGLNDYEQFLLSLCFCNSCKHRAEQEGVQFEAVRKFVQDELLATFERDIPKPVNPEFHSKGMDFFKDNQSFYEFLKWRNGVVTSLTQEVREAAHPRTDVIFLSLVTDTAWTIGVDVSEISKVCDAVLVCCYDTDARRVGIDTKVSRAVVEQGIPLLTGFRVFYPEVHSKDELIDKINETVENGASGLNFYNYGLIPKSRLNWIGATHRID
ncbi:hypothetical protein AAC03nite_09910 [Alicyclobacillus acidoterrestris]|nr:hypothetical protein AAC03nite_09910 [Alicyclobacillus acidoterrestris]